ncbi:unnamed protein product [Dicrocoelium dendriticum]|nr:unnamed protein product [Dicrocoelium dendriticum]
MTFCLCSDASCLPFQAAEKAIRQAERSNVAKLCVATDSKAVVHHASGSKMSGVSAPTRDAIKGLQGTLAKTPVEVSWKVVEGHSGIPGNVRADHLAKAGAGIAK